MRSNESGFTLIELVMVIVILGVLAATALPKFVDIKGDAEDAGLSGVAGGLESGAAVNFAARQISTGNGPAMTSCADVAATLTGGVPSGYSVAASGAVTATNGVAFSCTVTQTSSGKSQGFKAIYTN